MPVTASVEFFPKETEAAKAIVSMHAVVTLSGSAPSKLKPFLIDHGGEQMFRADIGPHKVYATNNIDGMIWDVRVNFERGSSSSNTTNYAVCRAEIESRVAKLGFLLEKLAD